MNENETKQKENKKRSGLKYIISFVVLLLLITPLFVFIMFRSKSDPASEAIIRQAAAAQLNKEPNDLTVEDFAKITELSIGEMTQTIFSFSSNANSIRYAKNELSNIKLLGKFTNLQKLNLGSVSVPENKIPNWMKTLSKAGIINLDERLTLDLSPLMNLHSLEDLQLGGPAVRNIKPLTSLNLKHLQIIDSPLSDIKPIESMTQLQKLEIIFCQNIKYKDLEDVKKALPGLAITSTIIPSQ